MDLQQLLQLTIDRQASDLHIIPGYFPSIRVNGDLYQINTLPLISEDVADKELLKLLSEEQKENLIANKEIDVGYDFKGYRFRTNIYHLRGGLAAAFRLIPIQIKSIDELLLPVQLKACVDLPAGLVLLAGPTGEGKSTTLAAIIEEINKKYSKHIITIEDPIEYIYSKSKSIVSQRQLRDDTHSWNIALRSALREDPDVILIGEMRDFETIQLALTAAETGHLVFSTLHTISAPETVNRIIDIFPSLQQNQIRTQLSTVLRMVIMQKLLPRLDAAGRIACVEILINSPAVSSVIREGKPYLLNNILETSEEEGLILFEKYLLKLYTTGKISKNVAFNHAIRPKELEKFIK